MFVILVSGAKNPLFLRGNGFFVASLLKNDIVAQPGQAAESSTQESPANLVFLLASPDPGRPGKVTDVLGLFSASFSILPSRFSPWQSSASGVPPKHVAQMGELAAVAQFAGIPVGLHRVHYDYVRTGHSIDLSHCDVCP